MFGAYNLDDSYEDGIYSKVPSEVKIHPDWNPDTIRYKADIAAILLEEALTYTKYIRPVCLPAFELTADEGYVSGWGKSQDKRVESIPKQIKVPIKTNEECFLEKEAESFNFANIASSTTFCAGGRNSQGPCHGEFAAIQSQKSTF